ncbi:MAG: hypothetical protein COA70_13860 [Planctomycetota bacterium]|nr:MAG: hypothetical protein COA70_13860 [Planctomycetota bacterium]
MAKDTNSIPIEVKTTVTSITVTVSSVEEALEFVDKYAGQASISVESRYVKPPSTAFDGLFKVLLKRLKESPKGLDASEVCIVLGVESPKAVGRKTYAIRRRLEALGVDFDGVIQRIRQGNGSLWLAGPLIDDAIEALGD